MDEIRRDISGVTIEVYAENAATGLPRTGLTHSDITAAYVRTRSTAVDVSAVALAGADAPHTAGGFVEIDATRCPGWYRFDLPDAAVVAGADVVTVVIVAAGVRFIPFRARLVAATAGEIFDEAHLAKAALVNKRVHTVSTGVDAIKDDDGETTLVTMTPVDGGEDVIEVVPS